MKRITSILIVVVMLASMFSFMMTGTSANALKKTYEEAANGDLLFEVKFGETTGAYVPAVFIENIAGDSGDGAFTVKDNGRTFEFYKANADGKSGPFWYGGRIEGLKWGADKTYTVTMKALLPLDRGGIYLNFPTAEHAATIEAKTYSSGMYGVYGKFVESGDLGGMKSGSRVDGRYMFNTIGYAKFDDINVATGSFVDLTFLIEGYSYAVFANGVFLDVVDIPTPAEGFVGTFDDIGFSTYLYHIDPDLPMVVKDVNVYKGDTVSATAKYPEYAATYEHYNDGTVPTPPPMGDATTMTIVFAVATLCLGAVVIKKKISVR